MKLLLLGGTFDPPHTGHMNLLQNAIAAVNPDKVLVVPASVPPHKQESATPAEVRLQMCECFAPLFKGLVISDMELCRTGESYTYDTVKILQEEYPGAEIFLCIGSDMLLSFMTWYNWRALMQAVTIVVQSRKTGEAIDIAAAVEGLRQQGGRVLVAEGEPLPVSSSAIRGMLADGKDAYPLIPPPADKIVREQKLYQQAKGC